MPLSQTCMNEVHVHMRHAQLRLSSRGSSELFHQMEDHTNVMMSSKYRMAKEGTLTTAHLLSPLSGNSSEVITVQKEPTHHQNLMPY